MYVCMYVCMRACMYVCLYVCMYVCVCVYVCLCMYVCMHVCMCYKRREMRRVMKACMRMTTTMTMMWTSSHRQESAQRTSTRPGPQVLNASQCVSLFNMHRIKSHQPRKLLLCYMTLHAFLPNQMIAIKCVGCYTIGGGSRKPRTTPRHPPSQCVSMHTC